MAELQSSTACTIHPANVPPYSQFTQWMVRPNVDWSQDGAHAKACAFCARMLREKRVGVWLEDSAMLHWYLVRDRECTAHDLFMPPNMAFGNWEVAFFFS